MKHFLSRSLSLLLVFALCLTIFPVTSLASEANTAEEKAQALYELGLFYGKGSNSDGTPNFALQDSATRNEAATMLIRLMGQKSQWYLFCHRSGSDQHRQQNQRRTLHPLWHPRRHRGR